MTKEEAIEILSDIRAEYNIFSDDEEEATRYHALSWAIRALNERTGRWIFGHTLGHSWMKCSECLVSQDGQTACFSYCPNCGAKMKEEEE